MPRVPDDSSRTAPAVLDGYQLLDVLGEGGMGVVYKAKDLSLGRTVALKKIRPGLSDNRAFLRRFRTEARALARINSPFIVGIHALRETDNGLLIDMEYVDGPTLKQRLVADGPLPWPTALALFSSIVRAFHDAHRAGVIHRDVKPHNVLLPREGGVKVTDFGLARMAEAGDETVTQGVAGTLRYMSPEQVRGHADLDARSDLFSLGLLLFEMLTGRLPFPEDARDFDVMRMIAEDDLPGPQSVRPDLPADVDAVARHLLQRDPQARCARAEDVLADLASLTRPSPGSGRSSSPSAPGERTQTASPPPPAVSSASSPSRRRTLLGGGLAALLLAVAVYLWGPSFAGSSGPVPVHISTDPAGAAVFADGASLGTTPLPPVGLSAGMHRLRIEHPGHRTVDTTLTLSAGNDAPVRLKIALTPAAPSPARLSVASRPPGADVFVDGTRLGTTPLADARIPAGAEQMRIEHAGFATYTAPLQAGPDASVDLGTVALTADAPPPPSDDETDRPTGAPPATPPSAAAAPATLRLHAPGAAWSVDGRRVASSGRITVAPGSHRVVARHPVHGVYDTTLTAAAGTTTDLTVHFDHPLTVNAVGPWGSVWINGENRGHTPLSVDLGPGEHRIALRIERTDRFRIMGGSYSQRSDDALPSVRSFSGAETVVQVQPGPLRTQHIVSFTVDS
mgnify:CR=1 FL=1